MDQTVQCFKDELMNNAKIYITTVILIVVLNVKNKVIVEIILLFNIILIFEDKNKTMLNLLSLILKMNQ